MGLMGHAMCLGKKQKLNKTKLKKRKPTAVFFSLCLLYKQEISFLFADILNENMGEK